MSNEMTQRPQKQKFSVAITTAGYQNLIRNTLSDPDRAKRFVASITSAVATNPKLQECDAGSILAGGLLGESLNLSPSPQLGQYYLVPFGKKAQFVLGYKGYIQLAIRSGQYKKLNVMEIKEGEFERFDPLNEEIKCSVIEDWDTREAAPTVGYYAMFEYINGFRKAIYWSKKQMEAHADKYSPAFNYATYRKIQEGKIPDGDLKEYSSFWYINFDDMAKKTMLRQLISRWGIMSIEMQRALEQDDTLPAVSGDDIITGASPESNDFTLESTDVETKVDLNAL
jgi:recombination protein RecT